MPVGHHEQIEVALGTRLVEDPPPAGRCPRGMHDTIVELDVVEQTEGLGIVVEIGLDL